MAMHTKKSGAAALLAAALLAGQAGAQTAPPAAAPAQAPQGQPQNPNGPVKIDMQTVPGSDWLKVCGSAQAGQKETCFTTRDFTTEPNQPPPVALAIYDVKGDDNRVIRALLPIGLLLKPGVRLSVDKGATIDAAFQFCMPNGCFAEAKVNGKTLDQMKKGTSLNIVAKSLSNSEVTFALPLANFGKSFDGAAIPAEELQKRQQQQQADLQKQLQERALAQRQAIEKAGAAGATTAAPAPGAPPAAPAAKP